MTFPIITDAMVEAAAQVLYERDGLQNWNSAKPGLRQNYLDDAQPMLEAALGQKPSSKK